MSSVSNIASHHHYCDLIAGYVDVSNSAIINNRNRFPFKQIFDASQAAEKNHAIAVTVNGDRGSERYVFCLGRPGLSVSPYDEGAECKCVRNWHVNEEYLRDVNMRQHEYIQNPAKLNWEWMYDA